MAAICAQIKAVFELPPTAYDPWVITKLKEAGYWPMIVAHFMRIDPAKYISEHAVEEHVFERANWVGTDSLFQNVKMNLDSVDALKIDYSR